MVRASGIIWQIADVLANRLVKEISFNLKQDVQRDVRLLPSVDRWVHYTDRLHSAGDFGNGAASVGSVGGAIERVGDIAVEPTN